MKALSCKITANLSSHLNNVAIIIISYCGFHKFVFFFRLLSRLRSFWGADRFCSIDLRTSVSYELYIKGRQCLPYETYCESITSIIIIIFVIIKFHILFSCFYWSNNCTLRFFSFFFPKRYIIYVDYNRSFFHSAADNNFLGKT